MVNVIGLGYIGLPTALMMASHGVEVVGTDYNEELVATLNAGQTTFKEDGLDELFADALKLGIKFTTEYQVCDTYIVSVPTPCGFGKTVRKQYAALFQSISAFRFLHHAMHCAIFSLCACHRNIYFFLEKEAIVSTGRQNIAKLHQRGLLLSFTAEL